MQAYHRFLEKIHQLSDLSNTGSLLYWDRAVNMPEAAHAERTQQIGTIQQLIHEFSTSEEMGELIFAAQTESADADPDSPEKRLIELAAYRYQRNRKISADYVARSTAVGGAAYHAWVQARANDDFAHFQPHLQNVIELARELAAYLSDGDDGEKYDALLNDYERGMKTKDVRHLFDQLKAGTVPLLQAIVERGRPIDDSFLHRPYDVAKQQSYVRSLVAQVGYDFGRGHLGTVIHPFMTSLGGYDNRITTRWYPDYINAGLFGALHEAGHAIYEQGIDPAYHRTPLANGTSLGIHESQSRSVENLIGRSWGFWQKHYSSLQANFTESLGDISAEAFYRAINKVQPSLIRVEADELTYNLHIILRFELEQAMLNGELNSADLPEAWREKMQTLLGIVPPNDALGCLQDVHWTRPSFGYFPTYALGNLYGAQFYETMAQQHPEYATALESGDPLPYISWLGEKIHTHGSRFFPYELVEQVTGQPLSHEPFLRYVTKKFSAIYEL